MAAANLVLHGTESVVARTGEEIIDILRGGQGVLNIVPLAGVKEELDAAIHQFQRLGEPGAENGRQAASGG